MLDGTQNNIDLDALVDTLLRERREEHKPEKPVEPSVATAVAEPVSESVAMSPPADPEEIWSEEPAVVVPKATSSGRRRPSLRTLFGRRPAEEEPEEDEADGEALEYEETEEDEPPIEIVRRGKE